MEVYERALISAATSTRRTRFLQPSIIMLTLLLVFTCLYSPVAGIRCVQCMSDSSEDCINSPPPPKECDRNTLYCIIVKETIRNNDSAVIATTRTCSPVDLGKRCQDSWSISGENVLVCYEACSTDGCNGDPIKSKSAAHQVSAQIVMSMVTALCIVLLAHVVR